MPKLVVVGGTVKCSHGGEAKLASGNAKLKIRGAEVVTAGAEKGLSFATTCPHFGSTSPPPHLPCTETSAATVGVSTKIKVGGDGVLLHIASGPATNSDDPGATWEISDAGQDLVEVA